MLKIFFFMSEIVYKEIEKTSVMWPSQNFLLHNGTIIKMKVTEWINNF